MQLARHPKRPHALDYIERLFTDFTELHGDRFFADDQAVVGGMAYFEGKPRDGDRPAEGPRHEAEADPQLRHAQAGRLSQGLAPDAACRQVQPADLTFLDTPGAYPGIDAEERGQAEAIALNLREMARLGVPVITVVIGEGGSGGALGMGIANRVFMLENAYYSVITPESCAAIIYRDSGKAPSSRARAEAYGGRPVAAWA